MAMFQKILSAPGDRLGELLYQCQLDAEAGKRPNPRHFAKELRLTYAQFSCALGFNYAIEETPEIIAMAGFGTYQNLAKVRNEYFTNDIYDRLGIKDVLQIYAHTAGNAKTSQLMQYLMTTRLERIESRIEATVNSIVIERYKKEMRAVYSDGAAQIDFAERRLANTHSGFRALLNEVALIVESRLIPVGDIFFRNEILPEEKRRLITRGLIPRS